jgi:predicted PurR-regulated permease PerM
MELKVLANTTVAIAIILASFYVLILYAVYCLNQELKQAKNIVFQYSKKYHELLYKTQKLNHKEMNKDLEKLKSDLDKMSITQLMEFTQKTSVEYSGIAFFALQKLQSINQSCLDFVSESKVTTEDQ